MKKFDSIPANYDIDRVNEHVDNNIIKYIKENEDEYVDNIREIAQDIVKKEKNIVVLSGPSSSGKTTTSYKLIDEFEKMSVKAFAISMDNFFIDNDILMEKGGGKIDFESIDCLELDEIHEKFLSLIQHKKTNLPIFDFTTGKRKDMQQTITLGEKDVAIFEGIHALNNLVWEPLPEDKVAKMYISAHSGFYRKDEKILSKRNVRLLRRMVRDNQFRSCPPERTIGMWDNVCRGEEVNIWPFHPIADYRLNTSFPYDVTVLKDTVVSILKDIPKDSDAYVKAKYLLKQLEQFKPISPELLPTNALLREFIGKSSYKY